MASTPEDWIKLNTLCSFNRMKKLKANVKRLGELCATSATIQVLESKKAIRRRFELICYLHFFFLLHLSTCQRGCLVGCVWFDSTPLPEELVRRRQTVWFQMLPDGFIEEKLSSRLTQFGQSMYFVHKLSEHKNLHPSSTFPLSFLSRGDQNLSSFCGAIYSRVSFDPL
jgi:hypothetical protein